MPKIWLIWNISLNNYDGLVDKKRCHPPHHCGDHGTDHSGVYQPGDRLPSTRTFSAEWEAPVIFLYVQPTTYGTSKRVTWAARDDDWVPCSQRP
jgi:hypothetical protein